MRHVFALIPFTPDPKSGEDATATAAITAWMKKHEGMVQDGVRLVQDQKNGLWFIYLSATSHEQLEAQRKAREPIEESNARGQIALQQRLQIGMAGPLVRR